MMIATLTLTGRPTGYQSPNGQPRIVLTLEGDTYQHREQLKGLGLQWIAEQKHWMQMYPATKSGMGEAKQVLIALGLTRGQVSTDLTPEEATKIMQQ